MKFSGVDTLKDLDVLEAILSKINKYNQSRIYISELIDDLENLLNQVITIDSDWKKEFRTSWQGIEVVYALSQNHEFENLDPEDLKIVKKSVAGLESITNHKIIQLRNDLENYLKNPDASVLKSAIELDSDWLMCPRCTDAWQSNSKNAIVLCPKCKHFFQNPRYKTK